MSDRLLYTFFSDSDVRKDSEGEQKLLYKVVMRTGTWALRPGPGGVKLKEPLKILRDKAPKGHISLTALKNNFDAGAKENVTFPQVHADGTTSDSGFVRKLIIEDVKDAKGKVVASKLWAGLDVTDSAVKTKVEEKSLVGCSGGVLFDYERTRDGKKFDQVLSHVMGTNSPWIDGCDGYKDKLPEGVMASENAESIPFGELTLESEVVEEIKLDAPPTETTPEKPAEGSVVWKAEDGFRRRQHLVQKSLDDWRRSVMASFPRDSYVYEDFPYMRVEDVTDDGKTQRALIKAGYGDDSDSWVANFKVEEEAATVEPFSTWTPAKKEWVAASEAEPTAPAPSAGRRRPAPLSLSVTTVGETDLRRAQRLRSERDHSHQSTTGGNMNLSDLLAREGVTLSDEALAAVKADEDERATKDARYAKIETDVKEGKLTAFMSELDKLDPESKLFTPGWRKTARNILLSDDGGTALMFSETTDSGARTNGVAMSATEIVKALVDAFPRTEEGKLALSQQATKIPGDEKPEENAEEDKRTAEEKADALLADDPSYGRTLNIDAPKKAA